MISDERLNQLIEYQNKWCAECELDDTEHIPREGLWDTHAALTELAQCRRTFAKIEKIQDTSPQTTMVIIHKEGSRYCATSTLRKRLVASGTLADTPFAALSALAESVSKGAGQ